MGESAALDSTKRATFLTDIYVLIYRTWVLGGNTPTPQQRKEKIRKTGMDGRVSCAQFMFVPLNVPHDMPHEGRVRHDSDSLDSASPPSLRGRASLGAKLASTPLALRSAHGHH